MSSELLHPVGAGAFACLRKHVLTRFLVIMPKSMVTEPSTDATLPGMRLKFASFSLDEDTWGIVWAYLTPGENANARATMTLQVEMGSSQDEERRIVPICSADDPVTGDYVDIKFAMDFVHAQSYGELYAFVAYWFLVTVEVGKKAYALHVVPITQELVDDMTRLCGRKGFQEKMDIARRTVSSEAPVAGTEGANTDNRAVSWLDPVDGSATLGTLSRSVPTGLVLRTRSQSCTPSQASSFEESFGTSISSRSRRIDEDPNRTLEVVLAEKRAVQERIKKSMSDLPRLYSREQELQCESEQLRAKQVERANG